MNKIIKIIYNCKSVFMIIFVSFLILSCNDAIDIAPDGQLTDDITYLNTNDLQLGLNGSYALYSPVNDVRFNSVFTDNCKLGVDNGGQLRNLYDWVMDTSNGNANTIWLSNYQLINSVNRIFRAANNITPEVNEQEDYNNILGQAHVLRALAHFQILQYYTTDYKDMNALSAIISDHVPEITELFQRNTNGEVYEFINNDLNQAEALLSTGFTDNAYITKDFITGLRARISLVKGDYSDAISYADDLIAIYPLANQVQYTAMFQDADDTEVIFKLIDNSQTYGGIFYFTNSAGPMWEVSNGLYIMLNNSDVRKNVIVNFTPDRSGPSDPANNYILINKYPGPSPAFVNNFKAMRISEMYLIKAEAQAETNDLVGAAITLKAIIDARYGFSTTLPVFSTKNEALLAVLNQRRIELAYEGHRFLDLKRLNPELGLGIQRNPLDCPSGNCSLPSTDHRFTLPIPNFELDAQPQITQNPGYSN